MGRGGADGHEFEPLPHLRRTGQQLVAAEQPESGSWGGVVQQSLHSLSDSHSVQKLVLSHWPKAASTWIGVMEKHFLTSHY